MKNKLVPALIGGASIFLISMLLSLVPRAGLYTCFFTILGGILAAYLFIRKSPTRVSVGEGIIVGAMAGAVTGLLRLAYLPINYRLNRENIDKLLQRVVEPMRQAGVNYDINLPLLLFAIGILAVVLLVIAEAVGGAIGVALFEKRKGETNPPIPHDESLSPGE